MLQTRNEWLEVLDSIQEFLPKLYQAGNRLQGLLRNPIGPNFWEVFADFVEGIDDLYRTLLWLDQEKYEYAAESHLFGIEYGESASKLADHFKQINEYIDDEHFYYCSEYVEYEFSPYIQHLVCQLGPSESGMARRYEGNMTYLQMQHPDLFAYLGSAAFDQQKYNVVLSRNGMANLALESEGNKKTFFYSRFNPIKETDLWAETVVSADHEDAGHCFMFGFGLGYHALSYSKQAPYHTLYVYEPDEQLFLAALKIIDLQEIMAQAGIKRLVIGDMQQQRVLMLNSLMKNAKEKPLLLSLPVYNQINKINISAFTEEFKQIAADHLNLRVMYARYGEEWMENSLINAPSILFSPSIKGMRNLCKGVPAVIVGAGPSLEADIKQIKELRGHALVIAAGSAIQSCLYHGVVPNLIVSIDGGEANERVFQNIDITGIPVLFAPIIKYSILNQPQSPLIHVYLNNDLVVDRFLDVDDNDPIFRSTLSVTGIAIQAAAYLGAEMIILTGQDLSYPGERMYATGVEHVNKEGQKYFVNIADVRVENVKGGENVTTYALERILRDIEGLISDFPQVSFINTTVKGAKIYGAEWRSMNEVVMQVKGIQFNSAQFKQSIASLPLYGHQRVAAVVKKLENLPNELEVLNERLRQMAAIIHDINPVDRQLRGEESELIQQLSQMWRSFCTTEASFIMYYMVFWSDIDDFNGSFPLLTSSMPVVKKCKIINSEMKPLINKMLAYHTRLLEVSERVGLRIKQYISG